MRKLLLTALLPLAAALLYSPSQAQNDSTVFFPAVDSQRIGQLISSLTAMETAWDLVKNPLTDDMRGDWQKAALVRQGFVMFTQTKKYVPAFAASDLACGHCHINAGQREKALPLVGVSTVYPEFNRRAGREFTLVDRIVGCLLRSMNGTGAEPMLAAHRRNAAGGDPEAVEKLIAGSGQVRAIAAYIDWISEGYSPGDTLAWRGLNVIPDSALIPVGDLDSARGAELFLERCTNCHGADGQGVAIGDIKAGPLWGPASWNDGAGAARVYTLAGMIRHMMPFIDPGSLTDEEAQHVAYFICTQPRPAYPYKDLDYRHAKVPADALYYHDRR